MATQMFKIKKIKEAIKDNDIAQLKHLAKKHGFLNNKLRKLAWPMLLGVNASRHNNRRSKSFGPQTRNKNLLKPGHRNQSRSVSNTANHDQIEKDISRSALNFYKSNDKKKQKSLSNLGYILHSMFDSSQELHYIQGFNDVVSVFYAVCDDVELAQVLSKRVAETMLSDYIMAGSAAVNFGSLRLILKLISYHDLPLSHLLDTIQSYYSLSFCVSWLLTWFAHQIRDINCVARIYDYCLAHNDKNISLYLSTALLIYFRKQLLNTVVDDVTLHGFFSNNEKQWKKIDFNKVIRLSEELFEKYHPFINFYSEHDFDEIKENFCGQSTEDTIQSGHGYVSDVCTNTPSFDPSDLDIADFNIENISIEDVPKGKAKNKNKSKLKRNLKAIPGAVTSMFG